MTLLQFSEIYLLLTTKHGHTLKLTVIRFLETFCSNILISTLHIFINNFVLTVCPLTLIYLLIHIVITYQFQFSIFAWVLLNILYLVVVFVDIYCWMLIYLRVLKFLNIFDLVLFVEMFLQIISRWVYLGLLESFCPGHVHLLIENVLLGGAFWLKTVSETFVYFVGFL